MRDTFIEAHSVLKFFYDPAQRTLAEYVEGRLDQNALKRYAYAHVDEPDGLPMYNRVVYGDMGLAERNDALGNRAANIYDVSDVAMREIVATVIEVVERRYGVYHDAFAEWADGCTESDD